MNSRNGRLFLLSFKEKKKEKEIKFNPNVTVLMSTNTIENMLCVNLI